MCGRLACYLSPTELCESCSYRIGLDSAALTPNYNDSSFYKCVPLYNLSPSLPVPVLIDKSMYHIDAENLSDYSIVPMRWGMIPRWNVGESKINNTHNARLETIVDSKMYGYEIRQNRRCVILCNGYYEWQTTRADKQPYYLYHENLAYDGNDTTTNWTENGSKVLKLAGVFSKVTTFTGDVKYSCSIITKEADSNLSWLHHRMPIPLYTYDDVQTWIKSHWQEGVDFLKKYGDVEGENIERSKFHIKFHAVNKDFVNKSSSESKNCIVPFSLKRKRTLLDNWVCKRKS